MSFLNKYISISFLLISYFSYAQSNKIVANIGYTYMNTSTGYAGLDFLHNANLKSNDSYSLGLGVFTGSFNNNFRVIPAANLSYTQFLFLTNLVISPKHINPNIGINLINVFWAKVGYSFSFDNKTNIKGITFGVNIIFNNKAKLTW